MITTESIYFGHSFVLLISGGLDSAVCLYHMHKGKPKRIYPLVVDYGQECFRQEFIASRDISCSLNSSVVADVVATRVFEPKKLQLEAKYTNADNLAKTYFHGRNTLLAALGFRYAVCVGASGVVMGMNASDMNAFPDCTPEWVVAMESVYKVDNLAFRGEGIMFSAPLLRAYRSEVVCYAEELGVPMEHIWSCYSPGSDGSPCGVCESCRK